MKKLPLLSLMTVLTLSACASMDQADVAQSNTTKVNTASTVPMVAGSPNVINQTAQTCAPVTQKEIEALFDRWNNSLKSLDSKKVAANYAPQSILLPTVSNKPRVTAAEKIDYFDHFLVNKPVGTIDQREVYLGCNTAVDAGLYTFKFGKTGDIVHARYTYTYVFDGKNWLISSHHSSAMPEKVAAKVKAQHEHKHDEKHGHTH